MKDIIINLNKQSVVLLFGTHIICRNSLEVSSRLLRLWVIGGAMGGGIEKHGVLNINSKTSRNGWEGKNTRF